MEAVTSSKSKPRMGIYRGMHFHLFTQLSLSTKYQAVSIKSTLYNKGWLSLPPLDLLRASNLNGFEGLGAPFDQCRRLFCLSLWRFRNFEGVQKIHKVKIMCGFV